MRALAIAFGIALALAGVAGFVPAWSPRGLLLGIFAVDAARNGLHFITGIFGVGMGLAGRPQATGFFRITGIVYAVLTAAGILTVASGELMGMAHNAADLVLQAAIASFSLAIGFIGSAPRLPPREPGLRAH